MRKDIFDCVVAFRDNVGTAGFNDEQKRLIEKLILHGKRNGKYMGKQDSLCLIKMVYLETISSVEILKRKSCLFIC